MKNIWIKIAFIGGLAVLTSGCGSAGTTMLNDIQAEPSPMLTSTGDQLEVDASSSISGPSTETPKKDGSQMSQTVPSSASGLQSLIEEAKEELAKELSIVITQIKLLEAQEVVWSDSSLGCPQPGMRYKQVPEDGVLIVLEALGIVYEYHYGGSRGLFLCERVFKDTSTPPQLDIQNLTPSVPDKNNPTPATPDNGIPPNEDN